MEPGSLLSLLLCAVTQINPCPDAEAALVKAAEGAPRHAFAFGVVGRDGESAVRTAGRLDERQPFEAWARVPLGHATLLLLEEAIDTALAEDAFALTDAIGDHLPELAEPLSARSVGLVHEDRELELPYYYRYLADPGHARPLEQIVAAHAFELLRYERSPDPEMLNVAMTQLVLERATGKGWSELLAESAQRLGLRDVKQVEPLREPSRVVRGRDADGEILPAHFAEVASFGNATVSLGGLAELARACLVSGVPDPAAPTFAQRAMTRRFSSTEDSVWGFETHYFASAMCGVSLHIEVLPTVDLAFFVFGNAPPGGKWKKSIRDAIVRDTHSKQFEESPPPVWGLGAVGLGGPPRFRWPLGRLRMRVPVGEREFVVDVKIVFGREVDVWIDGEQREDVEARVRWKAVEVHAPLAELGTDEVEVALDFTLARDEKALVGTCAVSRKSKGGFLLERLPRPARFEPVPK